MCLPVGHQERCRSMQFAMQAAGTPLEPIEKRLGRACLPVGGLFLASPVGRLFFASIDGFSRRFRALGWSFSFCMYTISRVGQGWGSFRSPNLPQHATPAPHWPRPVRGDTGDAATRSI